MNQEEVPVKEDNGSLLDVPNKNDPLLTSEGYNRYTLNVVMVSYEGEKVNGLCHNAGVAVFKSGQRYKGMFEKGIMHGYGEYTWPDNTVYKGDMCYGSITGKGHYTWADGSSYEGDVVNGFRHGKGIFRNPNVPCMYDGEWKNGLRAGKGTLYYDLKGTSYYVGEWVNGKRHGHGKLTYISGNTYEGEWRFDRKQGQGTMIWKNLKQRYTGSWENDEASGSGDYAWEDIAGIEDNKIDPTRNTHLQVYNRYIGDFKHGVRHGEGTFFSSNGAVFKGTYDGNRKHGYGIYVFENGTKYVGQFELDRMKEKDLWTTQDTANLDLDVSDLIEDWARNLVQDSAEHYAMIPQIVAKEKIRISNVLLRFYDPILEIYRHYCKFGLEDEVTSVSALRMSLYQAWQFLSDCGLLCAYMTRADIDRMVFYHLLHDEDCPTQVLSEHISSIHDSSMVLLVREFAELLVRVAYYTHEHNPRASGERLSFSNIFKKFYAEIVSTPSITKEKAMRTAAYIRPIRQKKAVRSILYQNREALEAIFNDNAVEFEEIIKNEPFTHYIPDSTMTMRNMILLMRKRGLITDNVSLYTCFQLTKAHPEDDLDSHMESQVVFEEFMELMVIIGMYVDEVEAVVAEKRRIEEEKEAERQRILEEERRKKEEEEAAAAAALAAQEAAENGEFYSPEATPRMEVPAFLDEIEDEDDEETEEAVEEEPLDIDETIDQQGDDDEETIINNETTDEQKNNMEECVDENYDEQTDDQADDQAEEITEFSMPMSAREEKIGLGEWTNEYQDEESMICDAALSEQIANIVARFIKGI